MKYKLSGWMDGWMDEPVKEKEKGFNPNFKDGEVVSREVALRNTASQKMCIK